MNFYIKISLPNYTLTASKHPHAHQPLKDHIDQLIKRKIIQAEPQHPTQRKSSNLMNSINLRSSIDNTSPSAKQYAAARKADPSKLNINVNFNARKNRPKLQRAA